MGSKRRGKPGKPDRNRIPDWPDFLERHADKVGNNVSKLAQAIGLSVRQLNRYIHNEFDLSTKDWLLRRKMEKAKNLLVEHRRVKPVAEALGYQHRTNFSRAFLKATGVSPLDFIRQQLRKPPGAS